MRLTTFVAIASLCFPFVALADVRYTITTLPPLSDQAWSSPYALNANGVIAGEQTTDPNSRTPTYQPILWQNGIPVQLPLPATSGWQGSARMVNAHGDIAGYVWQDGSPNSLVALWAGGQLRILDTLGMSGGYVSGINDQGGVVGAVMNSTDPNESYAVLWVDGQATKIGNFPSSQTFASAINNAGQIVIGVGYADHSEAFLWSNEILTPIAAMGGVGTSACDINDAGMVVGTCSTDDSGKSYRAFLWKNGTTTELPSLSTDYMTVALAINKAGLAVGIADDLQNGPRAMLWANGQGANLVDLIPANSGWQLDTASDIADDGRIVGYGRYDGRYLGYLLTPVSPLTEPIPEPASFFFLTLGTAAMIARRR